MFLKISIDFNVLKNKDSKHSWLRHCCISAFNIILVHCSKCTQAIGQNRSRVFWLPGNSHSFECFTVNRELKQATFLSTRTPAGSKSNRYRWRMMMSAVLV